MSDKKPAIDRLEDFDPYKEYLKRSVIVDEFMKAMEKTILKSIMLEPKENLRALLITFMEWQEMRKEKNNESKD